MRASHKDKKESILSEQREEMVHKPLKGESKKQLKHMIEEKGTLQFCDDLSEKNVRQGTQEKAYKYSFAYGVISRGRNLTNIFSTGRNGRGASRCGRRERLTSVEEVAQFHGRASWDWRRSGP